MKIFKNWKRFAKIRFANNLFPQVCNLYVKFIKTKAMLKVKTNFE